jgi:multiple sugar transport system permease protein
LIVPILALAVKAFIGAWNGYMIGIVSMPSYPLLSTGLYLYEKAMAIGMNYPVYFCGAVICTIPVVVLFCSFQDVFLQNMSMGGLKG